MRVTTKLLAAVAVTVLFSVPSYANTTFTSTVTGYGTYGTGEVFILLNTALNAPGCVANAKRIEVEASNPNLKQILAVVISASATGASVAGAVNGCDPTYNFPLFDDSASSYIYLN